MDGRQKRRIATGAIIAASAVCLVAVVIAMVIMGEEAIPARRAEAVALVRIEGAIQTRAEADLFVSTTGAGDIVRQLRKARKDPRVRAVILRVDSPGGSPAASQEIHSEVLALRHSGLPVVASMGDVAASGGYYVACAADQIVASPSTLTGSIGVIMQVQNLQGLYEKLGVDFTVMKSGEFKDIGSPMREMTPEEEAILQALLDDVHDQFIHDVAVGRNMALEDVRELADGRVFTGRQAVELGLVDREGSLQDALDLACEMAGIEVEPLVVEYVERPGLLRQLLGVLRGRVGNLGPLDPPSLELPSTWRSIIEGAYYDRFRLWL